MGHYYGGMLDIYTDPTQQCAVFGGHMELIEVDELAALRAEVTDAADQGSRRAVPREVRRSVRLSARRNWRGPRARRVALDRLVEMHDLGSLAYYYMGTGNAANEDAISSIILGNSLLTARGMPVAGEYGVKNVQAMKIMDTLRRRAGRSPNITRWISTMMSC